MPRLPPSLLRHAHSISPHLATLLPVCRDLASARNELRWIREHVADLLLSQSRYRIDHDNAPIHHSLDKGPYAQLLLRQLCRRRGAGIPLQYILGSQPFGDLDIRCRPGVLIPRPETEAWASHLASIIKRQGWGKPTELRILDLCTGTGCIALLLHSLLQRRFDKLNIRGYDVDAGAVTLAKYNIVRNERSEVLRNPGGNISFSSADIFASDWIESLVQHFQKRESGEGGVVDVLVSNPPYISTRGFNRDTARSVRNYEPIRALVPPPLRLGRASTSMDADSRPEDIFYTRLLEIFDILRPRFAVFEVGDLTQGCRVAEMAIKTFKGAGDGVEVEIWRDWPDMRPQEDEAESIEVDNIQVPVKGSGNGRAVYIRQVV